MHFVLQGLVLLAAWLTPQEPADLLVEEKAHGFRISKPDASWTVERDERNPEADFVLTLRSPDRARSFLVAVAKSAAKLGPRAVRDGAVEKLKKSAIYSEIESDEVRRGGTVFPRVRARAQAGDKTIAVAVEYLAANERIYGLQTLAPPGDDGALLGRARATFASIPVERSAEDTNRERIRNLAARCGSEISWSASWDDAAGHAKRDGKLVLVLFESYRGIDVPERALSGPFVDPDLVGLLTERFVCFRMRPDSETPFRSPEVYGMGPHTWGFAILFVTPEGKIVRETSVGNPAFIDELARDVLASQPSAPLKSLSKSGSSATAADLVRRGEFERAEASLKGNAGAEGLRLRAAIRRRERKGDEALELLKKARGVAPEALLPEIDADEAIVLLRLGRDAEAEALLTRVVERKPASPRAAEAMFWLGACDAMRGGAAAGEARWKRVVDEHPENRWAWKAAANLEGIGSFVSGTERLTWPSPETFEAVTRPPASPLTVNNAATARRDALRFLLRTQQADGSWICPEQMSTGAGLYTDAITAIAGCALLAHADGASTSKEARAAVERALAFALAAHAEGRLAGVEGLMRVYSVWRQTYVLELLAQCSKAGVGDKARLARVMGELVTALAERQRENGGWPYVFLSDDPEGKVFDPSASFLTAGVLFALLDARAAEVDVPGEVIDRARRFLVRLRTKEGSFRYMPALDGETEGGTQPEAGGRGPVCALAVHRAGADDLAGIRKALDLFLRHRGTLRSEFGKSLCHTGLHGQGAHYLFFDYRYAAAAVRTLPAEERGKYRDAILEDVLAVRTKDGSFEDLPMLGRAYGTAMALLALTELEARAR